MSQITLYASPYIYGGVNQPYFKNSQAVEIFLNGLAKTAVNASYTNIKLDFNYELSLSVDLNVTEVKNYNFAKIEYNNATFYAYIVDFQFQNFRMTNLQLKRAVLFERPNYFQYFENFLISKATVADFTKYNYNSKHRIPNDYVKFQAAISTADKSNCVFVFCYFPSNFNIENRFLSSGLEYNFCVLAFKVNGTVLGLPNFNYDLIEKISPYIISMLAVPYTSQSSFTSENVNIENKEFVRIKSLSLYYSKELITASPFVSYRIYLGSPSNAIDIDMYKFYNPFDKNYKCTISCKIIVSPSSLEYVTHVSSTVSNALIAQESEFYSVFSLSPIITFSISSEQSFKAQNLYYDALTKNELNSIAGTGLTQAAVQLSTGVQQIGMGAGAMNLGEIGLGAGNINRGFGSIADTWIKTDQFKEKRKLISEQEKSKPATTEKGQGIGAIFYSFGVTEQAFAIIIEMRPSSNDEQTMLDEAKYYGVECYCEEDTFDFEYHTYNGSFYIEAVAKLKDTSTLTSIEYNEMVTLMSSGLRYKILE